MKEFVATISLSGKSGRLLCTLTMLHFYPATAALAKPWAQPFEAVELRQLIAALRAEIRLHQRSVCV